MFLYFIAMANDLTKETLYEGVKTLVENTNNHIHLDQQKLYTLFSIAFQYMVYMSTKEAGHYIIRVEDSYLLDKLMKRSKDQSTRKFMQSLSLPRRLKYGNSTFHLDFFNISTWAITNELPKERIKAALIVKSASKKPFDANFTDDEADQELRAVIASLPKHYYTQLLKGAVPKTITIAFDEDIEEVAQIKFPFIKEEPRERLSNGVEIRGDINFDGID
jgi:hypothetical protein